jgi:uncharacterized membrane protein YwzB|tara:strand:+ start:256 stop:414 length:159 start_codon:yes stop_codon:yes gene_type:complete
MTTDLKIYSITATAMLANFSNVDLFLKMILTAVAIGYTVHKWVLFYKQNKKK